MRLGWLSAGYYISLCAFDSNEGTSVGFVKGFCFRISDWTFHSFQETLRENKERLNRGTEELFHILKCSSFEDSQTLIRQNMMPIS